MGVLTLHPGSAGETLPIFSFEEEAEAFLRLAALGTGWRTRMTTVGELISVLYGPCVGVERVALDPLPVFGGGTMAYLVSLHRKRFVRSLVGKGEPPVGHQSRPGEGCSQAPGRKRLGKGGTQMRETGGKYDRAEKKADRYEVERSPNEEYLPRSDALTILDYVLWDFDSPEWSGYGGDVPRRKPRFSDMDEDLACGRQ
jgi:hypothetical protein